MVKKPVNNDHFWQFNDIGRQLSKATYKKPNSDPIQVQIAIEDDMFTKYYRHVYPIAADMSDLAEAVQLADRWSVPAFTKNGLPRRIYLQVPVRCPEIFNQPQVHSVLSTWLHFLTRDLWSFEFIPRLTGGRPAEKKRALFPEQIDEVALFSGGLDSTAGATARLLEDPNKRMLLVGVAPNNPRIRSVQKAVFECFQKRFPTAKDLIITFARRRASGTQGVNKRFRARGFGFLLAGAATALVFDKDVLLIYENGLGAFNFPFRRSEIGVDGHARGVHPLSLLYAGQLVSAITQQPFRFENPFLYSTKGEMCRALSSANLLEIIPETITCDRMGRQALQCGCCSSCLYRRQALLCADIKDRTIYRTDSTIQRESLRQNSHFRHMSYQVDTWTTMLDEENAWAKFAREYPSQLNDTVERICRETGQNPTAMANETLNVIERHVIEWQRIGSRLEQDLGIYRSQ